MWGWAVAAGRGQKPKKEVQAWETREGRVRGVGASSGFTLNALDLVELGGDDDGVSLGELLPT